MILIISPPADFKEQDYKNMFFLTSESHTHFFLQPFKEK